ncbi:hypothetical protein [Streptomyces sp. NPDC004726]
MPVPGPAGSGPRKALWIGLGAVGATALIATTMLLTNSNETSRPASAPGATAGAGQGTGGRGAQPTTGANAGTGDQGTAAGGNRNPAAGDQAMGRIQLPETFLNLSRDDNSYVGQSLKQQESAVRARIPNSRVTSAAYTGGLLGENYVVALAVEKDSPISAQERSEILAHMPEPDVDEPGMTITHSEVTEEDPGPLGGILRCSVGTLRTDNPDPSGNHTASYTICAWLDANTYVTVSEGAGMNGLDLAKAAENARRLRAEAETRR